MQNAPHTLLATTTIETRPAVAPPKATTSVALVSMSDAKKRLGNIGTTKMYADIQKYGLRIIAFGGRSMLRSDELDALIERLTAESEAGSNRHKERAKVLATKAVAARRAGGKCPR